MSRDDAQAPDPLIGVVLAERYRILERLGEGGMGLVYRGEHILMKKAVAIKLLHQELGTVEEAARRFEREAQSASRLSHPSIVATTDFGRVPDGPLRGTLYLVMEYVPGRLLADVLADGPLPVARAVGLARLILRGLAHAHEQGVIHRDLKPTNIMVLPRPGGGDLVKILDFGIAKLSDPGEDTQLALTRGGMIFGTPSYMSPEQAAGEVVDARSDLYTCGVILFELLTGRKPFQADDLVKLMAMQVTAPPPSFAQAAPGRSIHPAIEAVVMRALRKSRQERYASAVDFLAALDEAERPTQSLSRLRTLLAQGAARVRAEAARVVRERGRRQVAAGVAAVILGCTALWGLLRDPDVPPPPRPVVKELRRPMQEVDAKIAAGDLKEARAILMHELSRHPKQARLHFSLGTIAFIENDPDAGLRHYGEALALDKGLRADPALLLNLRALAEGRTRAERAVDFLIDEVGKPGCALLGELGSRDKRAPVRARARAGHAKVGCADGLDPVASYELDLTQARDCGEKRAAVQALGATADPRAIEVLKRARRNRGGALGRLFGGGNDCVRKDIAAALASLGEAG